MTFHSVHLIHDIVGGESGYKLLLQVRCGKDESGAELNSVRVWVRFLSNHIESLPILNFWRVLPPLPIQLISQAPCYEFQTDIQRS